MGISVCLSSYLSEVRQHNPYLDMAALDYYSNAVVYSLAIVTTPASQREIYIGVNERC